ncbi:hypothetical protein scyTo_0027514, partial [Scyliorhinus torazame]|nr:hypothetical protein [Scyliorhinus torazame]
CNDSGLEDTAHVFEQGGKILSSTLGLVDISRGSNSYYKLQLLEDDNKRRLVLFSVDSGLCRDTPN